MRSEDLIALLQQDLAPVRRLPPPGVRLARWLLLVLPAMAVIVAAMGLRPDLAEHLAEPRFVAEALAALATGLAAAWAALASTVPGTPTRRLALPALPAALWLATIGEGCWREWLVLGPDSLVPALEPQCLPEIAAISIVPLAVLVLLARRGAALAPALTAALSALAAAALASAALSLFHHAEAAMVVLVWHFGGVALLSGLAALSGRRLFAVAA
ncbi:NrsF family protein [Magnetospirillum sp. UT-4]|uniref:NrsF family protein n=1 Tax=Magnetospirillum sp. UT-4 TaxID=2681467 RepID=UPI0013856561|nr:NrsF family protein [Magnetospirillum sp. UT-4]CAA7626194.1 conserved membrane hypothetical protein [Magnetospirillum sp. UT-4]